MLTQNALRLFITSSAVIFHGAQQTSATCLNLTGPAKVLFFLGQVWDVMLGKAFCAIFWLVDLTFLYFQLLVLINHIKSCFPSGYMHDVWCYMLPSSKKWREAKIHMISIRLFLWLPQFIFTDWICLLCTEASGILVWTRSSTLCFYCWDDTAAKNVTFR